MTRLKDILNFLLPSHVACPRPGAEAQPGPHLQPDESYEACDKYRTTFTWGCADLNVSLVLRQSEVLLRIMSEGRNPEVLLDKEDVTKFRAQVQSIITDTSGELWSRATYLSSGGSAVLEVHTGPGGRIWLGAWGPQP